MRSTKTKVKAFSTSVYLAGVTTSAVSDIHGLSSTRAVCMLDNMLALRIISDNPLQVGGSRHVPAQS